MFERFSDRARMVMKRAKQEAQRLGHEYVDTPHVLFALLKDGAGAAVRALKNLDIDLFELRVEIDKVLRNHLGFPEHCGLGYTAYVKALLSLAEDSASVQQDKYIGTEHLLLGLLRETCGSHAAVLQRCGVTGKALAKEIDAMSDRVERENVEFKDANSKATIVFNEDVLRRIVREEMASALSKVFMDATTQICGPKQGESP